MASKSVMNRQKSTRMVVAAIREHADRIQAAANGPFDRVFAAAVVLFFSAIARYLEHVTDALVAADETLHRERGEDSDARTDRDEAVSHLRSLLITLGEDVRYMYGPEAASTLDLSRTPTDPEELRRYTRVVLSKLVDWAPKSEPRIKGYVWESAGRVEALSTALERLDAVVEHLAVELKQTDESFTTRNTLLDRHTGVFNLAASFVSQVLALVGETELSRRIRPSTRRTGNTEAVAAEDGELATFDEGEGEGEGEGGSKGGGEGVA